MAKRTIYVLLLALLLGGVIFAWSDAHPDACAAYLNGDRKAAPEEYVESGSHMIVVPCRTWLLRQSQPVQLWCGVDLVLLMMFGIYVWADVKTRRDARGG